MRTQTTKRKPKLAFFMRSQKGRQPYLYCGLYFDKKEATHVGLKMEAESGERWNKDTQLFEALNEKARATVGKKNAIITQFRADLDEIYYLFLYKQRHCTAQEFSDFLHKKRGIDYTVPTFIKAYGLLIDNRKKDVEAGIIDKRLVTSLTSSMNTCKEFLKSEGIEHIYFDEMKPITVNQFESFLERKKLSHSYIKKNMIRFHAVIRFAIANEWTAKDIMVSYKFKKAVRKEINCLTKDEIASIDSVPILCERMNQVRDVFMVSCWTGFAWTDLKTLQPGNIFQSTDGVWFAKKPREKNTQMSVVPLAPRVLEILTKYKDYAKRTGNLLPVISNQKMNQYLKAIGSLANITRIPLTTHVGRKSLATLLVNEGVSIEVIAATLGHSSTKTTERFYAQMRQETVIKTVSGVFNKLNNVG